MAFEKHFALRWVFLMIFGFAVGIEEYVDPDCEFLLDQLSRFPPSNAVVTRCCDDTGVRYECINGYQLVSGDSEIICNNSHVNGIEPECAFPKVTSCGNPGPIESGYFVGSDFSLSSHIKYSCYQGFKLHGHAHSRKCMDNGLWSEPPRCIFDDELELDLTNATDVISTSLLHSFNEPQCAGSEPDCHSASFSRRRRSIDVDHVGGLDLVFMFDGSSSIKKEEFRMGLRFAQELIRVLDATIRRGGIKIAALTFANNMRISLDFSPSSTRTLKKIWAIRKPGGCGSNLGRAMFLLRKRIAPKVRRDSKRALFIITNGRLVLGTSHKRAARLLKTENQFSVFAIGIGKNPDKEVLSTLVSEPVKDHFIALKVYGDVFSSVKKAVTSGGENVKCGISGTKPKSRSIRGNKATSGVWPWQVGIYWDRGRLPICGGALIGEQWVLTAAHCFYSNGRKAVIWPPWRYTVTAGNHETRREADTKQMAPVGKIYVHKGYRYKTHENDIALVRLQYKFKMGKFVRPACLPGISSKKRKLDDSGKHGFVAEWDRPQDDSFRMTRRKSRSRILVHTALVISPSQLCANTTKKPFNSSSMFCAMDKKSYKRDCRGDGGSPFVSESYDQGSRGYRWSVYGLVSWDERCGSKRHHRFFTRVFPYVDWIEKITGVNRKN